MIQALPMLQELFLFRLQVRITDLKGLGGMGWRLVGPWVLQMVSEPTLGPEYAPAVCPGFAFRRSCTGSMPGVCDPPGGRSYPLGLTGSSVL